MKSLKKIQHLLSIQRLDCWFSDCTTDRFFKKYIGNVPVSFALVTSKELVLFAHALDAENIKTEKGVRVVVFTNKNELWERVAAELARIRFPKRIGLTYSSIADTSLDLMGHGMFLTLEKRFKGIYRKAGKKLELRSAENIIYPLIEQRTPDELQKMEVAARRAHDLIEKALYAIVPGKTTEHDVWSFIQKQLNKKPSYFKKEGVTAEGCGWVKEGCPIVLAGAGFTRGGHARPGKKVIHRGETVYIDFGVRLTFKDGSRWASDLQRMGYVLKKGETAAPAEVQQVFDTLHESISKGIRALKADAPGYVVDEAVRGHITGAGYPSYNHMTGHPVGEDVHNPGAGLGEKSKRTMLPLQENGVYTIEPRIAIPNGGSIEEMVIATKKGGVVLGKRQESLFLIK